MRIKRSLKSTFTLCCIALTPSAFAEIDFSLEQAELRAQLTPVRYATLSAEMTGRIDQLPVREGGRVAAGDLLVSFDCGLQGAQLKKSQSQLASARNILRGNQRMAELNAIGQVDLANSELDVRMAQADVEYLQETLKRCEIRAPYAGSIGDQLVRAQEFIQAGTPLIEIIDDTALQLEFIAPSRWLNWLEPGLALEVGLDDTGTVYTARLEYTAAKVDAMSQSVKVVAVIQGQHPELKPGMSGRIRITPPTGN